MADCLVCGTPLDSFMHFGRMPIANAFLLPAGFDQEYFYELGVGFCPGCTMVQLTELVDPQQQYHAYYAYFSSTSVSMREHFRDLASSARKRYLSSSRDPFVVEIGSNDGIMLQYFARDNIRHLGVEPSEGVARTARDKGIDTLCTFFDAEVARQIREEHGPADLIVGANVVGHIPYLSSIFDGLRLLLAPGGVLILEDPYLAEVIRQNAYDQFYDEHCFYFSVSSVDNLCRRHGLELVDVEPQEVHGGSMRYTIAHAGARPATPAVAAQLAEERALGLDQAAAFHSMRHAIERSRDELLALLQRLKDDGSTIVGYGATAKSATVTNYCGIGPDLLDYFSDTTPIKQGKYSPGMHIPVRPYEDFLAGYPDYAVLFAWNHSREILSKEQRYREQGGRFVVYVPSVEVLEE